MGFGKYAKNQNIPSDTELCKILNDRMKNRKGGSNERLAILLGWLTKDKNNPIDNKNNQSIFSQTKYKFMLNAPFEISNKCCDVMKKEPAHTYGKNTGRYPITAQMASESRLRTQQWLQNGCNGFEMKNPISNPMSFWTNQDVLTYIHTYNIKICSVYGEIVFEGDTDESRQLSFADFGLMKETRKLKTTGCKRTGCMFCGYGCHLEKPGKGRFEKMKITHPQLYDYIMRSKDKGGLDYKNVINWLNENGNLNIRY